MITDAGRAHLDAIAAERQASREAMQAKRDAVYTDPAGKSLVMPARP